MDTERRQNKIIPIITFIVFAVTVALIYFANRYVPFMMDDLWYSTRLYDEEPIRSLSDIFSAQLWHYNNWGGRSMTHSMLQIVLMCGEGVADVLNTVMVFVLSGMITIAASYKKTTDGKFYSKILLLTAIAGIIFSFNANWEMSMFWQSGALNYLYITIFIIGFMHCYTRELEGTVKPYKLIAVWIIPLGIIAGWSNENMGPVAFLMAVATIIVLWRTNRKPGLWMYFGAASALLGSALCILAPGNFVRSKEAPDASLGLKWKLFLRSFYEVKAGTEFLFMTVLATFAVWVVLKYFALLKLNMREIFFLAGALLSWGAMFLSPHYPDRATFGTMILLVCAIISMTGRILSKKPELRNAFIAAATIIWIRGMFFPAEFIACSLGWVK